jgi:hypothetical protein
MEENDQVAAASLIPESDEKAIIEGVVEPETPPETPPVQ